MGAVTAPRSLETRLSDKRIVVVDDNLEVLHSYEAMIRPHASFLPYSESQAFLQDLPRLARHPDTHIVTDNHFPDGTFALLHSQAALRAGISPGQITVCSGHVGEEVRTYLRDTGITYLQKPFGLDAFFRAVGLPR